MASNNTSINSNVTSTYYAGGNTKSIDPPSAAPISRSPLVVPIAVIPELPERPRLSAKSNDEEILKEVCLNNGICHAKISQEGQDVEVLEMFFSGFPRLIGLHHFPNMHTLTVIGQSVYALNGLTSLSRLKELWVAECNIQTIEGLSKCLALEKLYLYGNQISCIENLEMLGNLVCLWLNNNKIKNIENLTNLVNLEELNLAENRIEKIGHALDSNLHLKELNLSGNPIFSLRDLTNLVRLPKLVSVSFKDPLYSQCPVSQLCNYSTHILFHLPSLQRLDTYDVTAKQLSELAYNTVQKKKMYYNMRVKTLRRNMAHHLKRLRQHMNNQLLALPHQRLRVIIFAIKEIERDMMDQHAVDDVAAHDSDPECEQNKGAGDSFASASAMFIKLEALKNRKYHWERKCSEIEEYFEEMLARIHLSADLNIDRLVVELETGGNVRFEEGSSTDNWFSSCHDLVLSRFCATDFRAHGVVGMRIHHIFRIHNRILRSRFEKKLVRVTEGPLGEYYPRTKNIAHKKLLEYLFWIWDPEMPGGSMEPLRIPEEGFMDAETYTMLGRDGAVPLSNSVSLSDRHRMDSLMKQRLSNPSADACPFRFGQLIVAKTYLGKSATYTDNKRVTSSNYHKTDSVFKPRKKCISESDHSSSCECSSRQCEWYVFDHELVLPEYIIEFEYITKVRAFESG